MAFQTNTQSTRRQLFLNFKGGTGKTTLTAGYGIALAQAGHRVLFVDLDPQGHLSCCLGIREWQVDKTLHHVLVGDTPLDEVIKKISRLDAYIVPSDVSLSATELALGRMPNREWRLVNALALLEDSFDVVLFDASPAITLLNLNAILACRDLIVPILPESLSLHGLRLLLKTLGAIEADFNHKIENIGILLNRYDGADAHCLDIQKRLKDDYKERVLATVIRDSSDLARQSLPSRFGAHLEIGGDVLRDIQDLVREIGPRKASLGEATSRIKAS